MLPGIDSAFRAERLSREQGIKIGDQGPMIVEVDDKAEGKTNKAPQKGKAKATNVQARRTAKGESGESEVEGNDDDETHSRADTDAERSLLTTEDLLAAKRDAKRTESRLIALGRLCESLTSRSSIQILMPKIDDAAGLDFNLAASKKDNFPGKTFCDWARSHQVRLRNHPHGWIAPGDKEFQFKGMSSENLVHITDPVKGWQFEKWSQGM